MKSIPLPLVTLALAVPVLAQTTSTPPAGVPLRPVVQQAGEVPTAPTYELALVWNERGSAVLTVPFKNSTEHPLRILGVQATGGLFVGDFPTTVAPGKEDGIAFVYQAPDNTDGDIDLIRVLTDQGVKEVRVKLARQLAASFSTRRLVWRVGEAKESKTADITVAANTTVPRAVRTTKGNTATLEFLASGLFRIKVAPGSTAEAQTFPVFVDFDPALPGGSVVLTCVVEKN